MRLHFSNSVRETLVNPPTAHGMKSLACGLLQSSHGSACRWAPHTGCRRSVDLPRAFFSRSGTTNSSRATGNSPSSMRWALPTSASTSTPVGMCASPVSNWKTSAGFLTPIRCRHLEPSRRLQTFDGGQDEILKNHLHWPCGFFPLGLVPPRVHQHDQIQRWHDVDVLPTCAAED